MRAEYLANGQEAIGAGRYFDSFKNYPANFEPI